MASVDGRRAEVDSRVRIGLATGYFENFWGTDWFTAKQIGGSERIVLELAKALASDHSVTVRLPYEADPARHHNATWVGRSHPPLPELDLLFCFDLFGERDSAVRTALVACRSDPPPHKNFDVRIYLSVHHARAMGDEGAPAVGGGVTLADYERGQKRRPGLVVCMSSPDRCMPAFDILAQFPDTVFTYRSVPGLPPTKELTRPELVLLQRQARVGIYPLQPRRPSDLFSMSTLELLAAGTPVIISDQDALPELWGDVCPVLPAPARLAQWVGEVEDLIVNKARWNRLSILGKKKAADYDWGKVAARYIKVATE